MANKTKKRKNQVVQKQAPLINNQLKKSFQIPHWSIYMVLAFTALIYIRAIFNDFASLDDDTYVLSNPLIRDFSLKGIKTIFSSFYAGFYHPLTMFTYLFEFKFFGLNPMPYHVVNVLLHLLNTWLVFILVEKLSKNKSAALIVSLLFALHPMRVESVAWITERKDVLYTFFYMLSLIFYCRYLKSANHTRHYFASLAFFVLSLLSKSAAVTLPVLLFAIDIYQKRKINAKTIYEKIPFFVLSLIFGIMAILSQKEAGAINDLMVTYNFTNRIFLFTYSIAFYIIKLIAPIHLSAMHYFPEVNAGLLPWYYYASLPFLIILAWLVVRKTKFRREILFGVFFFLITISVMLQIVPVGRTITFERFTYVPYIGLFYIAGQWISNIQKEAVKKYILVIVVLFLVMFSFLTWQRIGAWKDGNTLFTDIIEKYPNNENGYYMRGYFKKNQKDLHGALQDYSKCLALKPNQAPCLINRAQVYNELKDYRAALNDLNLAMKIDSSYADAYNRRGMAYDGLLDTAKALRDYNKAILIEPLLQNAYNNRGILKATMGNLNGALEDINKALALSPDDREAYSNRANIKAMMKDFSGATEDYSTALKYNPKDDFVLFNRGLTRLNMGDTTGACEDWHNALEFGNETAKEVINQFCLH